MNILITGGAGFIGTNLALSYVAEGHRVTVVDDFSRTEENLWLLEDEERIRIVEADISVEDVSGLVSEVDIVIHAAAQAAVTHSLDDPLRDLRVNAEGTIRLLEAVRTAPEPPHFIYLSTNKVYGPLDDEPLLVDETRPLDPCTPYGCSKAAADIYVHDYGRLFDLPTTVFRMSCIYGGHQYGDTHQGWVAHFIRAALAGEPLVVYGDGLQVRDLLHVSDVENAIRLAHEQDLFGVFNLGGGPSRSISILNLLSWMETKGVRPGVSYEEARLGDQKRYVSDTRKFEEASGWRPQTGLTEGLERLWRWALRVSEKP